MRLDWYLLIAAILAGLVPGALLVTRQELQKVRLRLVEELKTKLFKDYPNLPQIELIVAKYEARSDGKEKGRQALVMVGSGALIYFAVSFAGFAILIVPTSWLLSENPDFPRLTHSLLLGRTSGVRGVLDLIAPATILGIAFLGGFVFQIRYLVRATINQELSALAFVRAALQILQGMIVALVAFRIMGTVDGEAAGSRFALALGVAFVFGLFPNIGLARIAKFLRVHTKRVNEDALEAAKLIPTEVIDGIDAETAFRLEESNLYDVQNLATANPIRLYAETPFGLLQVFDWVLQAQLCTNVGPFAFERLRQHNIRTIFDLERAVLAQGAPEEFLRGIGAIIYERGSPDFRRCVGLPALPAGQPVQGAEISVQTIRHAVAIIVDDLHVHRLRSLWRIMLHTTAGLTEGQDSWLYQTAPLPGDAYFNLDPVNPASEDLIKVALEMARRYHEQLANKATQAQLEQSRTECLKAVRIAIEKDPSVRERLRVHWNPTYQRKREDERLLEVFYKDNEFIKILDPSLS